MAALNFQHNYSRSNGTLHERMRAVYLSLLSIFAFGIEGDPETLSWCGRNKNIITHRIKDPKDDACRNRFVVRQNCTRPLEFHGREGRNTISKNKFLIKFYFEYFFVILFLCLIVLQKFILTNPFS